VRERRSYKDAAGGNKAKNIHPKQRGRGWDDFVPSVLQYRGLALALLVALPKSLG